MKEKLSPMLSCEGLEVSRGGKTLFSGLGFTVLEQATLLVLGANGSGKSSLLRALALLMPHDVGRIDWLGAPVTSPQDYENELLYIGHKDCLKLQDTVHDNIAFWAKLSGAPMLIDAAIEFWGLAPYLQLPCEQLSAGWKKRVSLARLLTMPAHLWLLDEPATHLDDEGVHLLGGLIESRTRQDGAVIMTTHHMPQGLLSNENNVSALHLADFVPVMEAA